MRKGRPGQPAVGCRFELVADDPYERSPFHNEHRRMTGLDDSIYSYAVSEPQRNTP
jgi:hypothetical protein